ncbi:hypothetical protein CF319_g9084, partial [Tilletia indica]
MAMDMSLFSSPEQAQSILAFLAAAAASTGSTPSAPTPAAALTSGGEDRRADQSMNSITNADTVASGGAAGRPPAECNSSVSGPFFGLGVPPTPSNSSTSSWRSSMSSSAPQNNSHAASSSVSAAAASFAYARNQAKTTTRGRPAKPPAAVKLSKKKICLLPVRAWDERFLTKKGKKDVISFLWDQKCVYEPGSDLTVDMTAAEVMETIMEKFREKGWELPNGFTYAKTIGPLKELKDAGLSAHTVNGQVLDDKFGADLCYIVANTDECPLAFREYFWPESMPPPVEEQRKASLEECDWCLKVLPRSFIEDHILVCPRR